MHDTYIKFWVELGQDGSELSAWWACVHTEIDSTEFHILNSFIDRGCLAFFINDLGIIQEPDEWGGIVWNLLILIHLVVHEI